MSQFSRHCWRHQYAPLNGGSGKEFRRLLTDQRWPLAIITSLICLAIVARTAFLAGKQSAPTGFSSSVELMSLPEVFRYNRTFAERPSVETDQAWDDLFPEQGGFFRHPTLAPKRAAFAVFHQLHCLDAIRKGYWAVYDASIQGKKLVEDELPFMSSPSHMRHCIDLIRHSLMCQPDLTVEVKDEKRGGVTGFGTEHQCKDWDQLRRWTAEWETYKQGPRTKKLAQEHDHRHSHGNQEHE
ncbi:MAG: hypothetical protein M1837_006893 [Sclerophora amabilis]|nr:MAG: hypothetical protein M1837_006893 [Sclerophora amabilis]